MVKSARQSSAKKSASKGRSRSRTPLKEAT